MQYVIGINIVNARWTYYDRWSAHNQLTFAFFSYQHAQHSNGSVHASSILNGDEDNEVRDWFVQELVHPINWNYGSSTQPFRTQMTFLGLKTRNSSTKRSEMASAI